MQEYKFYSDVPQTAQNLRKIRQAILIEDMPVLIEGEPGVGKTVLVKYLARMHNKELVRINFSEETDISDLIGTFRPSVDKKLDSIKFEWVDGPLLGALKEGKWILFDEVIFLLHYVTLY